LIPEDHPRYHALVRREKIADSARAGIVAMEGVSAHGRGETFDYLIGERTTESALLAEKTAAAMLLAAEHPVISVNGNTAALAAEEIAALQKACGAKVEVNLFHRTEERMEKITHLLEEAGVSVLTGTFERLIPLSHDRAICLHEGIGSADLVLVPLEDGDRCEALRRMGIKVITIDLNPLSRTSKTADLTIVDELTRALPNITLACRNPDRDLIASCDNMKFLHAALDEIQSRLSHALD